MSPLDIFVAICSVYALTASTFAAIWSHRWVKVPGDRGVAGCEHCDRFVRSYFVDGAGRVTCKKCKGEGYADALLKGKVVGGSSQAKK